MEAKRYFLVSLDDKTYRFYLVLANILNRSIEDILADTILKCAEMLKRAID